MVTGFEIALCNNILDPFNTVWSGLGWTCLLILFPTALLIRYMRVQWNIQVVHGNIYDEIGNKNQHSGKDTMEMNNGKLSGGWSQGSYAVPDKYRGNNNRF